MSIGPSVDAASPAAAAPAADVVVPGVSSEPSAEEIEFNAVVSAHRREQDERFANVHYDPQSREEIERDERESQRRVLEAAQRQAAHHSSGCCIGGCSVQVLIAVTLLLLALFHPGAATSVAASPL